MKQLTIVALVVLMQLGGMVVLCDDKECYSYSDGSTSPDLPAEATKQKCSDENCFCQVSLFPSFPLSLS